MKLNFSGELEGLLEGINLFSKELDYILSEDGLTIQVIKTADNKLSAVKNNNGAVIVYKEQIHFFRALGLFVEAFRKSGEFEIIEEPQFKTIGIMIDVSQGNAVINTENVKKLLLKMAVMGLNMLMLYTEDSYEIESDPYFGYMRGRYSSGEIRECDDFASRLGIEMIPCIQTLAHLIDALKWDCYSDIKDDDDTLLVGSDKTYDFIERMIAAATAPYRSRRIHIGMDEAWKLGRGTYMDINGCRDKFDVMVEHLERVLAIVSKYGLKPMMWSDMFFKAGSNTGGAYTGKITEITPEMAEAIPDAVQMVYWNYKHHDANQYVEWLQRHKKLGMETIFAGGIWSWNGYGVDYDKTFVTSLPALEACKKEGVEEVFVTIWGDGGAESNIYSNLLGMQLFAELGFSNKPDMKKLERRFEFCTGASFKSFMEITEIDKIPGTETVEGFHYTNPSKYLLWQDLLMGLFDKNIEGLELTSHYERLRRDFEAYARSGGEYAFMFSFLEKLCSALSMKAEMGLKITAAYRNKNNAELYDIIENKLPELAKRVDDLRKYHRELWFKINKPFGWEVLDIRYGGVLTRIESVISRIDAWLKGETGLIEELEHERLYFSGVSSGLVGCKMYSRMPSASRLSFSFYF